MGVIATPFGKLEMNFSAPRRILQFFDSAAPSSNRATGAAEPCEA